jgi:hypothetical protein
LAILKLKCWPAGPVLYADSFSKPRLIDLVTGSVIDRVPPDAAASVAKGFSRNTQPPPRLLGLIRDDQWTVSGNDADRPLYQFSLGDEAGTEIYVSSISGRAVQITTAHERFWNWLGAVPHWLYFADLRRKAGLWSQIVIYTSLMGCFLAGIGIYIGVRQFANRPAGRWSPYRGFNLWHHLAGLGFGIFVLTWVVSGLLSMNPWGLLAGGGTQKETLKIRGGDGPSIAVIGSALQAMARAQPAGAVSIEAAPFDGRLYLIASNAAGRRLRLDAAAAPAPLSGGDLTFLAKALQAPNGLLAPELLTRDDTFYFSHHRDRAALPVYRLLGDDGTRYYLDPVSGMLTAKIDRGSQGYRWLHQGLHRMDFTPALRGRPQWDLLMLLLLSGVTAVCSSGAYLGARRLLRR